MKKLLRFLVLVLSFVLMLGLFAACGETPNPDLGTDGGSQQGGDNTDDGNTDSGNQGNDVQGGEIVWGTTDLTLMSFNIRTTATEANADNNWSNRKGFVIDYIKGQDASVICMQEVKQSQYTDINAGVSDKYGIVYYGRESGSNPEGLAVAYEKSVWNKVEQSMFWLSETPDTMSKGWGASYYRICVNVLLEHRETGAMLNVFNVHLDNKAEAARENGMKLVLSKVEESKHPSFVAGDMNCRVGSAAINAASEAMQDCQAVAPVTEGGITFNSWGKYADDYDSTAIDFCFVSKKNMTPLVFDICRDRYGTDNNYYSDHYAVKTKVRMTYVAGIKFPDINDNGFDGKVDLVNGN